MKRCCYSVLPLLIAFCTAMTTLSSDLSYIDDDELSIELGARKNDIERTSSRIDALNLKLLAAKVEIGHIELEVLETDKRLEKRCGALYRLSRHGKTLHYLFASESGTAFLKRLRTLKQLVSSELEAKRKAGLRLAQAQSVAIDMGKDLESAKAMLVQLQEARDELNAERRRRSEISVR